MMHYEIVEDYRDGFTLTSYNDIFERYDYIVGDHLERFLQTFA